MRVKCLFSTRAALKCVSFERVSLQLTDKAVRIAYVGLVFDELEILFRVDTLSVY